MDKFLNLSVSGLVTGAIYSMMASGLVLTYTTSGIFNFAHGAIAFATAYLYFQLHVGLGWPIAPALIVSAFVFAPLLGLVLDRVLLRRLAKAPVYAGIVGTIGLLVALPNLVQWLVITAGIKVAGIHSFVGNDKTTQGIPVPGVGPTPAHNYRPFGHLVVNTDELAVFIVAALAAAVLWYVIRRTRLGLEMRAVVDRDTLAGLRGVNAARTSAAAWVMTMVLAGLGGVLIAPLFTLTDYVYTLVVLGALAVVVLGGMRSIPVAFVGGLGLGVLQNWVAGYSDTFLPQFLANLSGLKPSVPFLLTLVLLFVFGRDRTRRAGTTADDVPRPDHRVGLSKVRRRLPWAIAMVALVAYSQQWFNTHWFRADSYGQTVIAQGLAVAIIFLSFVVITGMGGMVSLAQGSFVTVGGFTAGWALTHNWGINIPGVATHGHVNFLWATAIAVVAAALIGALLALPITKLGGISLALGTLAFALFCSLVIFPINSIGHGQAGWTIRQPAVSIPGLNQLNNLLVVGHQRNIDTSQLSEEILVFLAVFGALTLALHAFHRSASGRAVLAVRSSEVAAEASGIRANRTKILLFAFSAGIAGLGGVLLGLFSFQASNSTAPPLTGLFWLALAVTFGIRRPGGALLAGLAFACGTAVFHWVGNAVPGGSINDLLTSVYFLPILSGIGAINLAQEPDGVLALAGQQRLAKRRAKRRAAQIMAAEATIHDGEVPEHEVLHTSATASRPASDAALSLRGIVAGYGDVEVLHNVDVDVHRGEVVALVGANGAGKSTLCGVAAGLVSTAFGSATLVGEDLTLLPSFERARRGLLVVPEVRGIFPGLTVEENLMVSLRHPDLRQKAFDRFPILSERRAQPAGLLSGGEQQMLSLAPALASPPTVLIADEPTLGLAPLLADLVMKAILELRNDGTAVLLVEEHARNALTVADTLVFMELGTVVWTGRREDADIELLSGAYLGSSVK